MLHTQTTNSETFARLQSWQRHLVLKHDPLFMPGDTLAVREADTRNEIQMEIKSIEPLASPKSRKVLVGLYAPYSAIDDVPDSVGGGAKQIEE